MYHGPWMIVMQNKKFLKRQYFSSKMFHFCSNMVKLNTYWRRWRYHSSFEKMLGIEIWRQIQNRNIWNARSKCAQIFSSTTMYWVICPQNIQKAQLVMLTKKQQGANKKVWSPKWCRLCFYKPSQTKNLYF